MIRASAKSETRPSSSESSAYPGFKAVFPHCSALNDSQNALPRSTSDSLTSPQKFSNTTSIDFSTQNLRILSSFLNSKSCALPSPQRPKTHKFPNCLDLGAGHAQYLRNLLLCGFEKRVSRSELEVGRSCLWGFSTVFGPRYHDGGE